MDESELMGVKVPGKPLSSSPMDSKFPAVSKSLLEHLDALFPDECPKLDWEERLIWYRVGQRSVVALLHAEFEQQSQEAQL